MTPLFIALHFTAWRSTESPDVNNTCVLTDTLIARWRHGLERGRSEDCRGRMHGQGLTRETGYNSVARSQVR